MSDHKQNVSAPAESELKPCPFCGGDACLDQVDSDDCWSVGCEACDFQLMTGEWNLGWHKSKEKAISAWNYRALIASAPASTAQPPSIGEITASHIAAQLHYPEHWDTAAYPTVADAFIEVIAHFQCTSEDHAAAQPDTAYTYASTQATNCAGCGQHKHTPLRIDAMGGYVCLTCIDQKLGSMLGEFGYEQPDTAERQAFEKWAVNYCAPLVKKGEVLRRSPDGTYAMFSVQWNWDAWQARAVLTAPQDAQERDAKRLAYILECCPPSDWALLGALSADNARAKIDDWMAHDAALTTAQPSKPQDARQATDHLSDEVRAIMEDARYVASMFHATTVETESDAYDISDTVVQRIDALLNRPSTSSAGDQSTAQPADKPTLICNSCGADRFKEDCKGARESCPIKGVAL
ncbi:MAG TPA: Lar family restriction alleviation protein [Noviherbaspirillum sp.]|nr:Lar family restriction alleviation protein [Noviherbaspirillum sp.]